MLFKKCFLKLWCIILDKWNHVCDDSGAVLFDRSPHYFEPLLNYLRHGELIIDSGINPKGLCVHIYLNILKFIL